METTTRPGADGQAEANAAPSTTAWGVIEAKGDDASAFLHGQLTQDVALLGSDQARLAALCNAKGRMLASMVVVKLAGDHVLLAIRNDMLAGVLKRLQMFVLRAKVKLSDQSASWRVQGVLGRAVHDSSVAVSYTHLGLNPGLQRLQDLAVESPPCSLVGKGGIGETVAQDHLAARQGRLDHPLQVVTPRGKHQQRFGQRIHRLLQYQRAQDFGQFRAAGFTGDHHHPPLGTQSRRKPVDVGGLACPIDALEADEQGFQGLPCLR